MHRAFVNSTWPIDIVIAMSVLSLPPLLLGGIAPRCSATNTGACSCCRKHGGRRSSTWSCREVLPMSSLAHYLLVTTLTVHETQLAQQNRHLCQ
ncbi:hypothetical protein DFH27DRAFT_229347 [Peziza echinospora]|nr:hypothetical protein DFH27DRAFT_229347 [Peziza echinospora]